MRARWLGLALAAMELALPAALSAQADSDGDGLSDAIECPRAPCDAGVSDDAGDACLPGASCPDTDGDGAPDHEDPDDDGDGVRTSSERRRGDTDEDGVPDHLDADDDGDGKPTSAERAAGGDVDTDRDGLPDHLDADDDGDGIATGIERADEAELGRDLDGDGLDAERDVDSDGDGILDVTEGRADEDRDGVPDYLDPVRDDRRWTGGAACQASPARPSPVGAAVLALLALLAACFRRRRANACAVALAVALAVDPSSASAQAVRLDQYRSADLPRDGFVTNRPVVLEHLEVGAQLHFAYALSPLVVEGASGSDDEVGALVRHQLGAQASVAVGLFERLAVGATLPVTLAMRGDSLPGEVAPDGAGLGDLALFARGRVVGDRDDPIAVAARLAVSFPSAQAATPAMRFLGDDGVVVTPGLLIEGRLLEGRLILSGELGGRLRATDRARLDIAGAPRLDVSHELAWSVAVAGAVVEELLELRLEAWGASTFERFGDRATSPVELLLGARVEPGGGVALGIALGLGVARGYGAPDLRVALTLGWSGPLIDAGG